MYNSALNPREQHQVFLARQREHQASIQSAASQHEAGAFVPAQEISVENKMTTDDVTSFTPVTLFVEYTGSLNDMAKGCKNGVKPSWSISPEGLHAFQRVTGYMDGKPVYGGDVSKGLIFDMDVESVTSSFPRHAGVNISNIIGTECTADGKRFAFIAEKKKSVAYAKPKSINVPISQSDREMLELYNDVSVETLWKSLGLDITGEYIEVPNTSPIMNILRHNHDLGNLTMDFGGLMKNEPGSLPVESDLVYACIGAHERAQKSRYQDLRKFKVEFEPVGAETWDAIEGIADNIASQAGSRVNDARFTNKYTITAKINMNVALLGDDPSQVRHPQHQTLVGM